MQRREVANSEIEAYLPLCSRLARKFTGLWQAEWDDLRQEGMIAVWLCLAYGFHPTSAFVEKRMRNWVNKCRMKGFTDEEEA